MLTSNKYFNHSVIDLHLIYCDRNKSEINFIRYHKSIYQKQIYIDYKKIAEEQPMHILNVSKMSAVRVLSLLLGSMCIVDVHASGSSAYRAENIERVRMTAASAEDTQNGGKRYSLLFSGQISGIESPINVQMSFVPSYRAHVRDIPGMVSVHTVCLSAIDNCFSQTIVLDCPSPNYCFRFLLSELDAHRNDQDVAGDESDTDCGRLFKSVGIKMDLLKTGDILELDNYMHPSVREILRSRHSFACQEVETLRNGKTAAVYNRIEELLEENGQVMASGGIRVNNLDIAALCPLHRIIMLQTNSSLASTLCLEKSIMDELREGREVAVEFLAAVKRAAEYESDLSAKDLVRRRYFFNLNAKGKSAACKAMTTIKSLKSKPCMATKRELRGHIDDIFFVLKQTVDVFPTGQRDDITSESIMNLKDSQCMVDLEKWANWFVAAIDLITTSVEAFSGFSDATEASTTLDTSGKPSTLRQNPKCFEQ